MQQETIKAQIEQIKSEQLKLKQQQTELENSLEENVAKNARLTALKEREDNIKVAVDKLDQEIEILGCEKSRYRDELKSITLEKCIILGHDWVIPGYQRSHRGEEMNCTKCNTYEPLNKDMIRKV